MKTNPSFRVFKLSALAPLGIAIAAALLTQPVRATAINNIVITENSSTSLTATYNGSPVAVTFFSADHWTITFPSTVMFNVTGVNIDWVEPDNADLGNAVVFAPFSPVFVTSDASTNFLAESNGATVTVGSDSSNGGTVTATFFDNGDVAAAPDTGSTLGLLSLSVVALLGATRLRFLQLAA